MTEEIKRESKEELLDSRSLWKGLLEHAAFKRLQEIAGAQLKARREERVRMKVANMEDVAAFNLSQGEEAGIELFIKMPSYILEQVEIDLERLENENGR